MSREFWSQVVANDFSLPQDRTLDDLTAELVRFLGDPDPALRDRLAYPVLATWIERGIYDDVLHGVGDGVTTGLRSRLGADGDDSVFRRSFSALLLAEIVGRDNQRHLVTDDVVVRWGDNAMSWFVREVDHRGWVPQRGWAHAMAHGSDLLGSLARSRHFGQLELTVLLDVVADRLVSPTQYRWRNGEDDRLGYAVMAVLHRNLVPLHVIEPWLARLGAAAREHGAADSEVPTPPQANTGRFLRALHLQLALGVQGRPDPRDTEMFSRPPTDRTDILLALIEQLRQATPWLFVPSRSSLAGSTV